ncbi:hypothetical protein BD289DRAFT_452709 [Coniella lustricola]|uniref:Uncharacterized protein n=1 Tax=Coniella lustricola TaxID=2025994 RepID=A0A2T3AA75_9PEZI|nr:hypothetical protein BD289DRAFT_452709 [Coniella lustricola]
MVKNRNQCAGKAKTHNAGREGRTTGDLAAKQNGQEDAGQAANHRELLSFFSKCRNIGINVHLWFMRLQNMRGGARRFDEAISRPFRGQQEDWNATIGSAREESSWIVKGGQALRGDEERQSTKSSSRRDWAGLHGKKRVELGRASKREKSRAEAAEQQKQRQRRAERSKADWTGLEKNTTPDTEPQSIQAKHTSHASIHRYFTCTRQSWLQPMPQSCARRQRWHDEMEPFVKLGWLTGTKTPLEFEK